MARIAAAILLSLLIFLPIAICNVLTRDVAIIGGGSSGTYAAIHLQKLGYSIALIEKEDRLGGHVDTYTDPTTGQTFDNGVVVFDNITVVNDYFGLFDISLSQLDGGSGGQNVYADFAKKTLVKAKNPIPSNYTAIGAAFEAYQAQVDKYPYLTNGFNLPKQVPEDLLLPWGDFIRKYELEELAYTVFEYNQGIGNVLAQPTLYMIKYLNSGEIKSLLTNDFVTTTNHDNQALYNAAAKKLGSNVLLSSNVSRVIRGAKSVELEIDTPSGKKVIQSRKLLIAIPPKLGQLSSWLDLSHQETMLFGQFNNSYYWCGLVSNTGIPDNTTLTNVDPKAPFAIPAAPVLYGIGATGLPGLHSVYYSTAHYQSDETAKAITSREIVGLSKKLGAVSSKPEFVYFHNHSPFFLTVDTDAIRNGFYGRLEALQGQQNTFYTGAAWQTQDSSAIWNFTHYSLLPRIVHSLAGH